MKCLLGVGIVALCLAIPAAAREGIGELGLLVRPVDLTPSGRGAAGARIEVVLQATVPVEDVRLTFLRSDGTPLTRATRRLDPGPLSWRRTGSADPEDAGTLVLAPGTELRATVVVPLAHRGSYEIVVRATGTGPEGPVVTEGMARLDFDVASSTGVERDGVIEFQGKEGRP
jgi:hypothetical protein